MSVILGLNAFHPDASACLLIDGKLVGAVAEERLGKRDKHTMEFPVEAIRWLLSSNNLRLSDISHVAVARSRFSNISARVRHVVQNPLVGLRALGQYGHRGYESAVTLKNLHNQLGESASSINYEVHSVEHHLAHIASSYYVSSFESETAAFSYDGSGDFISAMAAQCEGTKINIRKRVALPHSLGHFYTALCQFIGFDLFGEEYKVMGLAPYGADTYHEEMKSIIIENPDGTFQLNENYFNVWNGLRSAQLNSSSKMKLGKIYSKKLIDLLGMPRDRDVPLGQREKDIARSTQVRFEVLAEKFLKVLGPEVSTRQIVLAGGCALNGVMNARIYRNLPVDEMYIQPAASDDGTAIGAAFHCWHVRLGKPDRFEMKHAFWGPEYSESQIKAAIEDASLKATVAKSIKHAAEIAAKLIADGAVLGWYQGRSEWGPRALGHRSILANPAIRNMKDIINQKIKKRESFRPFAPSVLVEDVPRYFEQNIASPFMMHVVKFRPEWREVFPAVVHRDGTGRLQSVDRENNPDYHHLISCVKHHTGHGVVLNTSFNENEPVVDTPEQAIACFLRTDMDALVLGRHVLLKPGIDFNI